MVEKNSQERRRGCFAWLVRVKKSVNERLARVRNSLKRRLAREDRLGKPLTPDDLENEAGSPDLIITRVLVNARTPTSPPSTPSNVTNDEVQEFAQTIIADAEAEVNGRLVTLTVREDTESLSSSVLSMMANETVKHSLTNIVHDLTEESNMAAIRDTESLSSGALSDMAEAAVTESLSKIIVNPEAVITSKTEE